ncbi:MAG TPA: hypothetical protein DHW65_04305 [Dehalococcoidia bacterium]|nr:hypothetical protein [Chloroflexota bacterium]HCL25555.1 hypothetical protein [Dehalococcoidia bacterium]
MSPIRPSAKWVPVFLIGLLTAVLTGCSSGPVSPNDLLLGPDDFPGTTVTETSREAGETSEAEPAVQVELKGPDFVLLESLVLFESDDMALGLLASIKQDQISQGVTPHPLEGFEDNSGVIDEHLHDEEGSTVFFVQGEALVRLTLTGPGRSERIWDMARLAREKANP